MLPSRAQMLPSRAQMLLGRAQMHAGRAQTAPKCQKTLEGHISLKTHVGGHRCYLVVHRGLQKVKKLWKVISHSKLVQIGRLRCFLASTKNIDA